MTAPALFASGWSRPRFYALVGVFFVLQVGLILLFGARMQRLVPPPPPSIRFSALGGPISEDQLLRLFFAGDPAVFPWPGPHGFSGRAWMNQRPEEYQPATSLQPPSWLALDTNRLGTTFPGLAADNEPFPLGVAPQRAPQFEPLPAFLPPERIRAESVFHLEGALARRLAGSPPVLSAMPPAQLLTGYAQLLTRSVVEIAVNPAGDVIASRLLDRCGSPAADKDALAKVRALRFRPAPGSPITWSRAVFDWQTAEPPPAAPPN